jgi:hypothetical protein
MQQNYDINKSSIFSKIYYHTLQGIGENNSEMLKLGLPSKADSSSAFVSMLEWLYKAISN